MSTPTVSQLQKEIKQQKPFASIRHEALLSILHTADAIRRRTARLLEPYDITAQQYNVLRILRGAGDAGLPTLEIANRMVEQAPGITRMIDRLEAKGWVERERGGSDRRQVVCRIAAKGLDLLAQLDEPAKASGDGGTGSATDDELAELIRVLDEIRAASARD
jgi:DNA-binding MarR family transcriptional regulator